MSQASRTVQPESVFDAQTEQKREVYKQLMDRYEALEEKYPEEACEQALKELDQEVHSW